MRKENFRRSAAVKARVIGINDRVVDPATGRLVERDAAKLAGEILALARKEPENFKSLVARYSEHESSRAQAGIYLDEWWTRGPSLREELADLAFSLEEGEIGGPLPIESGAGTIYFIVKVERKIPEGIWPIDVVASELAESIRNDLQKEKREEFTRELFGDARIEDAEGNIIPIEYFFPEAGRPEERPEERPETDLEPEAG